MNILHIHSSTRSEGSHSFELAYSLFEQLEEVGLEVQRDTLNLWDVNLPAVDARFLSLKTKAAGGDELTNSERVIWSQVENLIARIKTADAMVWSIPMWNFGAPYIVKQFIDVVTQYGYLFTVNESGYAGLLNDKPTLLALSRGGSYGPGSGAEAYDHQEPYMKGILGFWGIQNITVARREFTMGDPTQANASAQVALDTVKTFAANLADVNHTVLS